MPVSALHPIFAMGTVAIAVLTAAAFAYISPVPAAKRYGSLDGLRGLLALFVMLQHAAIWRQWEITGERTLPPSRFFVHLGQGSVSLFFMVTAFLFGSKLLETPHGALDWTRMYVSRALRLIPLYLLFVFLLVFMALASTNFVLRESVLRFNLNVVHWLAFTMFDMPSVNRVAVSTFGGQAWSLPYEWLFYLVLPLMAVLVGRRDQSHGLVLASAIAAGAAAIWVANRGGSPNAVMFLGGWLAAVLMRGARAQRAAARWWSGLIALSAVAYIARTPIAFDYRSVIFLSIPFLIVAGGNTLFGVLTSAPLRVLGEISYSLYLLHGIGLYFAFTLIGSARAARLTPTGHWLVVYAATPLIIILCWFTYRTVEAPAMAAVDAATARVRSLFGRRLSLVLDGSGGSRAARGSSGSRFSEPREPLEPLEPSENL
jgi:peptidoglycan/LPS O-acetylase OafA/YrhL